MSDTLRDSMNELMQFANNKPNKGLNFNLDEIDKNKIKFEPKIQDGNLILKPISKNNKLDELFSGFEGEVGNHKLDISWGEPVGNEIW